MSVSQEMQHDENQTPWWRRKHQLAGIALGIGVGQPWAHLLALSFQGYSLESLSLSLLVLRTTRQLKNN